MNRLFLSAVLLAFLANATLGTNDLPQYLHKGQSTITASLNNGGAIFHGRPLDADSGCHPWSFTLRLMPDNASEVPTNRPSLADRQKLMNEASIHMSGNTIFRRHSDRVVEKLEFADAGAEHSVVLNHGPEGGFSLNFLVLVRGLTDAKLVDGDLIFESAGCEPFKYEKLVVTDADNRVLSSQMSCSRNLALSSATKTSAGSCSFSQSLHSIQGSEMFSFALHLEVLEGGKYPIVVDPFLADAYPEGKILASDSGFFRRLLPTTATAELFGYKVGAGNFYSANTGLQDVVVSAPGRNNKDGGIYLYRNNGASGYSFMTTLDTSTTCLSDGLGLGMAVGKWSSTTYDTIYSGSNYCFTGNLWTGTGSGVSTLATSDRCLSFAIGGIRVCATYGQNSWSFTNGGTTSTIYRTLPGGSTTSFNFNSHRFGNTVYADAYDTNYFVADTHAIVSNILFRGFVRMYNSASTQLWQAFGPHLDCGMGKAIVRGNFDGQWGMDVIIGANHLNGQRANAGGILIYLANGAANTNLPTAPSFTVFGNSDNEEFGYALANAGDLNSDNIDDFIVGGPFYGIEAGTYYGSISSGRIYVYFGVARSTFLATGPVLHQIINGVGQNAQFGFSLPSFLRRHSNQNFNDLVVGAPGFSDWRGAAYVIPAVPFSELTIAISSNRVNNDVDTSNANFQITYTIVNNGPATVNTNDVTIDLAFPTAFIPSGYLPAVAVPSNFGLSLFVATPQFSPAFAPGTSRTFTITYTLSSATLYPASGTFTASIRARSTAPIISAVSSSLICTFFTSATVNFLQTAQAFDSDLSSPPACSTTINTACPVSPERPIKLRNLGFRNVAASGQAFGNSIRITYPDGVTFTNIQDFSGTPANLATLGWTCYSPAPRETLCIFPNLPAGQTQSTAGYELMFSATSLAQGGGWRFVITFLTGSRLTNAPVTMQSNLLIVPATTCDVAPLPESSMIVNSYQCTCPGGGARLCAGGSFDVSLFFANTGFFSAAGARVTLAIPLLLPVSAGPTVIYRASTGSCTVLSTNGTHVNYNCPIPGGVIDRNDFATITFAGSTASSLLGSQTSRISYNVITTTQDEVPGNNFNKLDITFCRSNIFRVQLNILTGNNQILNPSATANLAVAITNLGPSDYTTGDGKQYRIDFDKAGLTVSNAYSFPMPANIPSLTRGSSVTRRTDYSLTSGILNAGNEFSIDIQATASLTNVADPVSDVRIVRYRDSVNTQVVFSTTPSTSVSVDSILSYSATVRNLHPVNTATNIVVTFSLPFAIEKFETAEEDALPNGCTYTYFDTSTDPFDFHKVICVIASLGPSSVSAPLSFQARTISAETLTNSDFSETTIWFNGVSIQGAKPDTINGKNAFREIEMVIRPDLEVSIVNLGSTSGIIAQNEVNNMRATVRNIGTLSTSGTIRIENELNVLIVTEAVSVDSSSFICSSIPSNTTTLFQCMFTDMRPDLDLLVISFAIKTTAAAGSSLSLKGSTEVTGSGPAELNLSNNVRFVNLAITESSSDLDIGVIVDSDIVLFDSAIRFTVTVSNRGPSTAANVIVFVDEFDATAMDIPSANFSTAPFCSFGDVEEGYARLECILNSSPSNIILAPQTATASSFRTTFSFTINTGNTEEGVTQLTFEVTNPDLPDPNLNNNQAELFIALQRPPPPPAGNQDDSGLNNSAQVAIALIASLSGTLLVAYGLKRAGFFKRKEKPPALDAQGDPAAADDD